MTKQLTPYQVELLNSALRTFEATALQDGNDLLAAETRHLHLQIVNATTVDLDAAAPDMLAALKVALAFIEEEADNRGNAGSEYSDYEREPRDLSDLIAAAIAKAEGRS